MVMNGVIHMRTIGGMIINYLTIWLTLLCIGALLAEAVTGRPNGPLSAITNYPNQKFPSLFIGLGVSKIERAYHIHHWIWSLCFTWGSYFFGNMYLTCFFSGICLQGLSYGDRFKIRVNMEASQ